MISSSTVYVVFCLFVVLQSPLISAQTDRPNPKCDPNNLNQCTSQLLQFAKDNVPLPETVEDVEVHCNNVRNASRCVRGWFRECAPPTTKQMARVVMTGVNKRIKKNCSPYGTQEILKHTECMGLARASLRLCYHQGVKDIYNIRMSSDKSKWHNLVCCFGSRAHDCMINAIRQNCEEKEIEFFQKQSNQMVDELMDSFCPTNLVWGKSGCAKLVSTVADNPLPKDKNITVLPLLMDIVKEFSVDEEDSL